MTQELEPGVHGEGELLKIATCLACAGYWQDIKQVMEVSRGFRYDEQLWDAMKDEPCVGGKKRTPLMYSSKKGDLKRVVFLLRRGADVEAVNEWGWNALGYASGNGHLKVVRELCYKGAKVNAGTGLTPLMWACQMGKLEVVKELCTLGANLEASFPPFHCDTPLFLAVKNSQMEVVRELCKLGAKVDTLSFLAGHTPLMWVCWNGKIEMAELLCAHGAHVNGAEKEYGFTPLMFATRAGSLDIVRLLISRGASLTSRDKWGKMAMDFVTFSPQSDEGKSLRSAVTPSK